MHTTHVFAQDNENLLGQFLWQHSFVLNGKFFLWPLLDKYLSSTNPIKSVPQKSNQISEWQNNVNGICGQNKKIRSGVDGIQRNDILCVWKTLNYTPKSIYFVFVSFFLRWNKCNHFFISFLTFAFAMATLWIHLIWCEKFHRHFVHSELRWILYAENMRSSSTELCEQSTGFHFLRFHQSLL